METFEIDDDEIEVEDIMRKIKDNLKRRKEIGGYREAENVAARDPDGKQEIPVPRDEIQKDLDYINSNWDIQNNGYFISSHRRVTGKALIKGRGLIHDEVRRYVDPMIWKQKEFNWRIVTILNEVKRSIDQIDDRISRTQAKISSDIEEQVRAVVGAMNEDIENRAWLAGILEGRIAKSIDISSESSDRRDSELNYYVFEERFRGSRADIKGMQSAFIKHFEGCKNVLDIGCGRGEFLELLREHGIKGHGIDINEDMTNFCRSRGLDVELIDALSYLDKLEDKKLDGIFIDQVVEHLEADYLIRMLGLCYKKLIYGGAIVVETVNPLSFSSFANFYLDMSHKRPVHPETLRFLLGAERFREIETLFFAAIPEERRLIRIALDPGADENELRAVKTYNHNIDILNNTLFGPQDYAVVGRK